MRVIVIRGSSAPAFAHDRLAFDLGLNADDLERWALVVRHDGERWIKPTKLLVAFICIPCRFRLLNTRPIGGPFEIDQGGLECARISVA